MRSRRSNKIRCQSPIVVVVAAAVVVVVVYLKVLVLNRQGMRQRNQLLSNTDLVLELAGIIRQKRTTIETKTCQRNFPLCDQPDQISFTIIWIS